MQEGQSPLTEANKEQKSDAWRVSRRNLAAAIALAGTAMAPTRAEAFFLDFLFKPRPKPPGSGHQCFLVGTSILTPSGERDIAQLCVGDLVTTVSGAVRSIKNVTQTLFSASSTGDWSQDMLPVTIKRGALGSDIPKRDLYLSQAHAIYIDNMLVPVANLVNGRSIVVAAPTGLEQLDYRHIELDSHDVILAEGAACETLMPASSRSNVAADQREWQDKARIQLLASSPVAVIAAYNGNRAMLRSRLRSALSPIVDMRTPLDIVRDRLEDRAEAMMRAA